MLDNNLSYYQSQSHINSIHGQEFNLHEDLVQEYNTAISATDEFTGVTNTGGDINKRLLFDIMRLARGQSVNVLDDIGDSINKLYNYSAVGNQHNLTGASLFYSFGDPLASDKSSSLNVKSAIANSGMQRQYLASLIEIITSGTSSVYQILVESGMPANADTEKQAELLVNNMTRHSSNFTTDAQNVATRIQASEQHFTGVEQNITSRNDVLTQSIQGSLSSAISGGGQGGR